MPDKSIIIIGAGIGGLSAGCYGQMNGYATQIFEQHTIPGGVCTGWKRRGFTFDGCVHHLAGCTPDSKVHRMWRELGAMPHEIYYPKDLICIEGTDGRRFTVHTDIDRLEAQMLELAPASGRRALDGSGLWPWMPIPAAPNRTALRVIRRHS